MGGGTCSPWLILLLLPLVWAEIRPSDCARYEEITSITKFSKICDSLKNSIIAENCLPGNDSTEWDVNADGDPSIQVYSQYHSVFISSTLFQGFATKFSVVKGDIVQFKIKTDSSNYRVDIFRVGWFADHCFPIPTKMRITITTKITITIATEITITTLQQVRRCWSPTSGEGGPSSFHPTSTGVAANNLIPVNLFFIISVKDQPECVKDSETLHFDCGGWGVSAEWEVPQVLSNRKKQLCH